MIKRHHNEHVLYHFYCLVRFYLFFIVYFHSQVNDSLLRNTYLRVGVGGLGSTPHFTRRNQYLYMLPHRLFIYPQFPPPPSLTHTPTHSKKGTVICTLIFNSIVLFRAQQCTYTECLCIWCPYDGMRYTVFNIPICKIDFRVISVNNSDTTYWNVNLSGQYIPCNLVHRTIKSAHKYIHHMY